MQGSPILRGVIATLVSVGVVSPESSQSYCTTDGTYCHVYGDDPDNNWDGVVVIGEVADPYDPSKDDPSWLGGDSSTVDPYCQDAGCDESPERQICEMLYDALPEDCTTWRPPELTPNGCGSGIFTGLIPDFLIVPDSVVDLIPAPFPNFAIAPFGNLFTQACNNHDRCYGIVGSDKAQCDRQLNRDMVDDALAVIPALEHEKYMIWAEAQAYSYSVSLRLPFVEFAASQAAFDKAQEEAVCRALARQIEEEGC